MSHAGAVPGAEVIELLVSWAVTTALTFAVVIYDERRLPEERLENAWPTSTRTVAIVYLGVIALPFHFARTRGDYRSPMGALRKALGFALGVILLLLVGFVAGLIDTGVAWVLGVSD